MVNLRDVFIFNIKFDLCAFDHNLLDAQNSLKRMGPLKLIELIYGSELLTKWLNHKPKKTQ